MAATTSVRRLVADPSLGVQDMMRILKQFVGEEQSFDLLDLVSCPGHQTFSWKTSPNPSWMSKMSRLVTLFLGVAKNGVLPSAKLKTGILKLCDSMKINCSRKHDNDFADLCDQRIRIVMAQYRTVKQQAQEYQRLMKKATPEEKDTIDRCLAILQFEEESSGNQQASLALVPYMGSSTKPGGVSAAMGPSEKHGDVSAMSEDTGNIFQRILKKQDSSPSKVALQQAPPAILDKAPSMYVESAEARRNMKATPATMPSTVHKGTMVVAGDESISEFGSPVPKKAAATKSKVKKLSPQSPVVPGDSSLSENDMDIVNEILAEKVPISNKRKGGPLKKPSASPKASSLKKPAASPKASTEKKPSASPKASSEKHAAASPKGAAKKSSFRHRKTSTAYHSAFKKAKHMGMSPNSCKAAGRSASQDVSLKIDTGVLTEEMDHK